MCASSVLHPLSVQHDSRSLRPAGRWIVPSTPPAPRRVLLAAFTIASTCRTVISPLMITILDIIWWDLITGILPLPGGGGRTNAMIRGHYYWTDRSPILTSKQARTPESGDMLLRSFPQREYQHRRYEQRNAVKMGVR